MAADSIGNKVKSGPRKVTNRMNELKSEGDDQTVTNVDGMNPIHSGTKTRTLCHKYNSDRHFIANCPEKMERVSMATIEDVPLVINLMEQILATTPHRETREKDGRGRQQMGDEDDEIIWRTGEELVQARSRHLGERDPTESSQGDVLDISEDISNGAEGSKPLPKKITTLIRGCLNQSQNDNIPKTMGRMNNDSNVEKTTMDEAEGKGSAVLADDSTRNKVKYGPRKATNRKNELKTEGDDQTVANAHGMNPIRSGTKMRMRCHKCNSSRHFIANCTKKTEQVTMAMIEGVPLVTNPVERLLAITSHLEMREKDGRGRATLDTDRTSNVADREWLNDYMMKSDSDTEVLENRDRTRG